VIECTFLNSPNASSCFPSSFRLIRVVAAGATYNTPSHPKGQAIILGHYPHPYECLARRSWAVGVDRLLEVYKKGGEVVM
jgi:hypothetical protein